MAAAAASLGPPLLLPSRQTPISHHTLPRLPKPSATKRRPLLPPISSSLVGVEGKQKVSFTEPETALLDALLGIQGRGRSASPQQLEDVERAVRALEDLKGVTEPTSSSLIEGRWQLIFTTRPGTASPIQRTFVGVDTFKIFQEVYLRTDDPRVSNIVKLSDAIGELKVEAAATIKDGKRILFRLLGDEAKGWLDTTYLSAAGDMRISRGNKIQENTIVQGTTFVLQKNTEARQRLLSAISVGDRVMEVIDEILGLNQSMVEGDTDALEGEWQLLWTSQTDDESWENIASYGLKGLQIVKENTLENQIGIFPGFKVHSSGNLIRRSNSNMYHVIMNNGAVIFGAFKFPLNTRSKFDLELLFDCTIERQRENELKADHDTLYSAPKIRTPLPLELHASSIYTKAVFNLVQEELAKIAWYNVYYVSDENSCSNYSVLDCTSEESKKFLVFNRSSLCGTCSCCLMESEGIPCSHLLALFKHLQLEQIPEGFILKRWTIHVKQGISKQIWNSQKARNAYRIVELQKRWGNLIEEAAKGDWQYSVVYSAIESAWDTIQARVDNDVQNVEDELDCDSGDDSGMPFVHEPNIAKTKGSGNSGRPKLGSSRMKPDREVRKVKGRQCKKCLRYNVGHDSRNCPN